MSEDKLSSPPEPKLSVEQDDCIVRLRVQVSDTGGFIFAFDFNAGSKWAARMLTDSIRSQLVAAMETARRDAYEAGWKDRGRKAAKRTWFWGRMP